MTTAVKQLESRLGRYVKSAVACSSFFATLAGLRIACSRSFVQIKVINGVSDWRTRDDGAMKALVFIVRARNRLAVSSPCTEESSLACTHPLVELPLSE